MLFDFILNISNAFDCDEGLVNVQQVTSSKYTNTGCTKGH